MSRASDAQQRIRDLNDHVRSAGPANTKTVRWIVSRGVQQLPPGGVLAAIERVKTFEDFTRDNDPHGEHDFGAFEIGGRRLFWKIDYYDLDMEMGSSDPSHGALTCRVLTILLAEEY